MTHPAYAAWYAALPYARQLALLRAAGLAEADPRHRERLATAAAGAGLAPTATAVDVLYARQHGAVGCPACAGGGGAVGEPTDCAAVQFPLADVRLDPARFQNRTDAFSELSAEAVARHYDPNKFDPVVLWRDPAQGGRAFMLSGHSRYEGLKRRGTPAIPARFFQGTEAEAIQFARVDANRAATAENLVEDLAAYRLMRDGDPARALKPAKKSALAQAFKGKQAKLEAWSHLAPAGLFVSTLAQDNRTEFPYLEKFALWVGQLRARHGQDFTNTHETDCFNFFYSEARNQRLPRADFEELVGKRLAWGKPRLFPECDRGGCVPLDDLARRGPQADAYKELELLARYRATITQRLATTDRGLRVYTDTDRAKLKEQGQLIDDETKRLRRDLGQAEAAPGLFGVKDAARNQASLFGIGADVFFQWDRNNVKHLLQDHPERGLSLAELEDAYQDPDHVETESYKLDARGREIIPLQPFVPPRYLRVGKATGTGRLLTMVLEYYPQAVRIFSAREANRKFKALYNEEAH